MPTPYYVSPEQMMQDKAEYAKKGIAKGRSIVVMEYNEGIVLVADNPSSLYKISEVYDRIAFAGAGRYSEFENLRKSGIRHADMKGFIYSRDDVNAKSLVNAYSQALGTVFSQDTKPQEVEIIVVAVGIGDAPNEIYRVSFDGSIFDEKGFTVIGGKSDSVLSKLKTRYTTAPSACSLQDVLRSCVEEMGEVNGQKLSHEGLEVAILSKPSTGRVFRRLSQSELAQYLTS